MAEARALELIQLAMVRGFRDFLDPQTSKRMMMDAIQNNRPFNEEDLESDPRPKLDPGKTVTSDRPACVWDIQADFREQASGDRQYPQPIEVGFATIAPARGDACLFGKSLASVSGA
jgi:hypothetical protein